MGNGSPGETETEGAETIIEIAARLTGRARSGEGDNIGQSDYNNIEPQNCFCK